MAGSLREIQTLLLELLRHPPTANYGQGPICFYCGRSIWGQDGFWGPDGFEADFDFAPQDHKPDCLIARIGRLFPKESKNTPAFPEHTWNSKEPFTVFRRDFADGTERYSVRCNKCQEEHLLPSVPGVLWEDDGFKQVHYRICHAAFVEARAEAQAAKDRVSHPPCPSCGKPSSRGQLDRLGFCRRCELEKRELIQTWLVFFEHVFELPIPAWRAFEEIKAER